MIVHSHHKCSYNKSLKRAMSTAAKAPLVIVLMDAVLPVELADADDPVALPVADPEPLVELAVVDPAADVAAMASAVAFRVPHCLFCLHWS